MPAGVFRYEDKKVLSFCQACLGEGPSIAGVVCISTNACLGLFKITHCGRVSLRTVSSRLLWQVRRVALGRVVPLTDGSHLTTKSQPLLWKGCCFPGFLACVFQTGSRTSGELGTDNTLRSWPLGKWSANWVTEIALLWSISCRSGSSTEASPCEWSLHPSTRFPGLGLSWSPSFICEWCSPLRNLKAWGKSIYGFLGECWDKW